MKKFPKGRWYFILDHSKRGYWAFETEEYTVVIGSYPNVGPVLKSTIEMLTYRIIWTYAGGTVFESLTKFKTVKLAKDRALLDVFHRLMRTCTQLSNAGLKKKMWFER